jgi:hypothetical protein
MEYPQGIAPTACTFAQGAVAPQPTLVLVFGFNLMVLDYKRHKQYRDVRRLGQRIIDYSGLWHEKTVQALYAGNSTLSSARVKIVRL